MPNSEKILNLEAIPGLVFCVLCRFMLKPAGGINNDPNSICINPKNRVINFVTGEFDTQLCKDINHNGTCRDFEKKGD